MDRQALLLLWANTKPEAVSPNISMLCAPMWETLREGDLVLFTCPGKTFVKQWPSAQYEEIDGVSYQWQLNGKWVGEGCSTSFEYFESHGASKNGISKQESQYIPGFARRLSSDED
jgi:hypothetical protein